MACGWQKKCVGGVVTAVSLIAIGGGMIPLVDWIIKSEIKKKVVLTEGTEFYKMWTDIPFPIYMQFYLFDLRNPDEVMTGGKPYMDERGPYTYREYRLKVNLTHNANGTLTYKQKKYWIFIPDMSVGDENDTITTSNSVLLSLAESSRWESPLAQDIISLIISAGDETLFIQKTIKEILWGYQDVLLTSGQQVDPSWFYTNIAGYFAEKNNSFDGEYTVHTGADNIDLLGVIDKFNGTSSVNFWSTKWANMINGTDGTITAPFTTKSKVLYMFSTDVCRSVYGLYNGGTSSPQGIPLYRYSATHDQLANSSTNPGNIGFCTPQTNCLATGLLNVTQCSIIDSFHAPVIVSFPHFYMADPHCVEAVGGMNPNPDWHRTDVDLEPITGAVLQASKRLQVNLYVMPMEHIEQLRSVRTMVLPVFWINESAVIDDATAAKLQDQLFTPMLVATVVQYSLIAIGSALLITVLIYVAYRRHYSPTTKLLTEEGGGDTSILVTETETVNS